jgi:hypothetical protein
MRRERGSVDVVLPASSRFERKRPKRWRYYVSQAVLQSDKGKAGSIVRVPAADVEALVAETLE